jgi:hypothetical protein
MGPGARATTFAFLDNRLIGYPLVISRLMLARMTAAAGIDGEPHVQSRSGTRP